MRNYVVGFARGITPVELERQSGKAITAKTIRRIVNPYDRSPNLSTLDAIAGFFGVETSDLLKKHPMLQRTDPPSTPQEIKTKRRV